VSAGPDKVVRDDIRALTAYHVPAAEGLVKLDAMENPYRLPEALQRSIAEAVAKAELNRYPDPAAPALVKRLRETMAIDPGHGVLLGNGSDEIIHIIAQSVARPGAVVLAPRPSFFMFSMYARLAGMEYVGVPVNADFTLDAGAFLQAMERHRPAVVFIAYPNNPTGNLFSEEAIAAIIAAAPGLVVLDEAYHVFAGKSFLARLAEFPNLVVMRTLSKLGLAGIRLGYAVARPEWIREFDKVRPPYNVNVLTQVAAELALAHYDVLAAQARAIVAERERLTAGLSRLPGVTVFPSKANFVLIRVPDAVRVFEGMKRRGVLVKSMHGSVPVLLDQCVRLTIGTPEENLRCLAALAEALADLV
jgi:histidinol-phosphate aminotransferase